MIAWNAICVRNSTRASTEKGAILVVRAWKPTEVRVACFVGRHSALIFMFFRFNADGVVPRINRLESIVAELLSVRCKDLSPLPSLLLGLPGSSTNLIMDLFQSLAKMGFKLMW